MMTDEQKNNIGVALDDIIKSATILKDKDFDSQRRKEVFDGIKRRCAEIEEIVASSEG